MPAQGPPRQLDAFTADVRATLTPATEKTWISARFMTGPERRTVTASTLPGHGDGRAETVVVAVRVAVTLPVGDPVALDEGVPVGVAVRERVDEAVTEAVDVVVDVDVLALEGVTALLAEREQVWEAVKEGVDAGVPESVGAAVPDGVGAIAEDVGVGAVSARDAPAPAACRRLTSSALRARVWMATSRMCPIAGSPVP